MDRESCGLEFSCEISVADQSFRLGRQHDDNEDFFSVLAHSEHGIIPAKAREGGNECWYSFGGEEHACSNFEWINSNGQDVQLVESEEPPESGLMVGSEEDGCYFVVIAHTTYGDVPGKSKDGACWFPFGGKEHRAEHFSYVSLRQSVLHDGAMVHLESQHGGNVRVSGDDEVNGHGKEGKKATFRVIRNRVDETVKLQNQKRPDRYLAIRKCGLTTGSGGRYCVFKPRVHKNKTVSFQSVNFPGRHIGINEDKSARDPKKTGTGKNARFNIIIKKDD